MHVHLFNAFANRSVLEWIAFWTINAQSSFRTDVAIPFTTKHSKRRPNDIRALSVSLSDVDIVKCNRETVCESESGRINWWLIGIWRMRISHSHPFLFFISYNFFFCEFHSVVAIVIIASFTFTSHHHSAIIPLSFHESSEIWSCACIKMKMLTFHNTQTHRDRVEKGFVNANRSSE